MRVFGLYPQRRSCPPFMIWQMNNCPFSLLCVFNTSTCFWRYLGDLIRIPYIEPTTATIPNSTIQINATVVINEVVGCITHLKQRADSPTVRSSFYYSTPTTPPSAFIFKVQVLPTVNCWNSETVSGEYISCSPSAVENVTVNFSDSFPSR